MSLDKSIIHGKEKRKSYRKAASFDASCRPNGGCKYCESNRKHSSKKRKLSSIEKLKEN